MSKKIEHYGIAIREKKTKRFFEEKNYTFKEVLLPFSKRYWAADPFIFEKEDIYLFYELFDNISCKGVIAYSVLNDDIASKPKIIIDEDYHLSFPNVFEFENEIFMIPESSEANRIDLYKAVNFPDKWKRVKTLVDGVRACDTCVVKIEDGLCLITSIMKNVETKLPWCYVSNRIYYLNNRYEIIESFDNDIVGDYGIRNGGNPFWNGKQYIRVGQDCSNGVYGKGIVLWSTDDFRKETLSGTFEIKNAEACIEWKNKHYNHLKGVHTYNASEHYEVIDYYEEVNYSNITLFIYKIIRFLKRLLKFSYKRKDSSK